MLVITGAQVALADDLPMLGIDFLMVDGRVWGQHSSAYRIPSEEAAEVKPTSGDFGRPHDV